MNETEKLVKTIAESVSQATSSKKDEVAVMKSMINDFDYKPVVWGSKGEEGTICPAESAREIVKNVLVSTAGVSQAEAKELAHNHEFKKSDAEAFVDVSKEFVNTYINTNRKLAFGGREESNLAIVKKEVKPSVKLCPNKTGVSDDGKAIYERKPVDVPGYVSAKVIGGCPEWLRK